MPCMSVGLCHVTPQMHKFMQPFLKGKDLYKKLFARNYPDYLTKGRSVLRIKHFTFSQYGSIYFVVK